MNPVGILTGYYGSRGERIKHTVHDGALKLPKDALDLMDEAIEETGLTPAETYELPGLDAVVRPSIDPNLDTLIVTEISLERVAIPDPSSPQVEAPEGAQEPAPERKMIHAIRTKIENRTIERRPTSDAVGQSPAERIRGGGGEEEGSNMDVDSAQPAAPPVAEARPMDVDDSKDDFNPPAVSASGVPEAAQVPLAPAPGNPAAPQSGLSAPAPAGTEPSPAVPVASSTVAGNTLQPGATDPPAAGNGEAVAPTSTSVTASNSGVSGAVVGTPEAAPVAPSAPVSIDIKPAPVPPVQAAGVPQVLVTPAPTPTPAPPLAAPTPAETASGATASGDSAAPVPSSSPSNDTTTKAESAPTTTVHTLSTKPEPRWELHRPGPNDEMVTPEDKLTPKPSWYQKDGIADVERTMLPEWFDGSAPHRTGESYLQARETILSMSETISNRNLTAAMVRRSIVGDAGSLQRLRNFMSNWGLINEDAINDSAPTAPLLRENYPVAKQFDDKLRDELINAVVEQSNKRRKTAPDNSFVPINWEEVALQVGNGATSADCEKNFLSIPINVEESATTAANTERPITPEVSLDAQKPFSGPTKEAARQEFLRELVDSCDPAVVRKATAAALAATGESGNLKAAQSGAVLGLVAARAVEEAQKTESQLESILSQLLDQRMKKLENRMVMMDDVESILEAEKVALELERRDLYTARCRHWFGGT